MKRIICSLLSAMVLWGCADNVDKRLQAARDVFVERPDSALTILREISYDRLPDDDSRALYITTRAWVNARLNRSLITDTLLPFAAEHYRAKGDTMQWALATRALATHYWDRDDHRRADSVLAAAIGQIGNHAAKWEVVRQKLEIDYADGRFADAVSDIDWLLPNTSDSTGRLNLTYLKTAALYMDGRREEAVALSDSLLGSDLAPAIGSPAWRSMMGDHAEYLNSTGRCRQALEAMQLVLADAPAYSDEELLSHYLQMVKFQLNTGHADSARWYLDSLKRLDIPAEIMESDADINGYLELLSSAIDLQTKGYMDAKLSRGTVRKSNRRAVQRDDALNAMDDLSRQKYELTIERQRLWLIIIAISALALLIAGGAFLLWRNRRLRLVEAEERIDTLSAMLRDVENAKESSADAKIKSVVLRQLGFIKTFAGAPTAQNREVLRRLASAGHDGDPIDTLVDWPDLYAMADELYDGYHSRLTGAYPGLFSEKEMQIIILLKAGFSTKEIGVLTEQSSATIYVRKSAIRKKLATPDNADITDFISAALS